MTEELTRFEKTNVCFAIADAMNKEEARLDRIRKKRMEGEKTIYYANGLGTGGEDIDKVWERTTRILEALNNASKKISCSQEEIQEENPKLPICSPQQAERLERCILDVKAKIKETGYEGNPFAICRSSIGCRFGSGQKGTLPEGVH